MYLGTTNGVISLSDGTLEPLGLEGMSVTALHAVDGVLLAGTYGDGLWRRAGGEWERVDEGLSASTFRFVDAELAGTEPARVFRSPDGGRTWAELEGVARIPGHERWFLPYSPRAGAARNAFELRPAAPTVGAAEHARGLGAGELGVDEPERRGAQALVHPLPPSATVLAAPQPVPVGAGQHRAVGGVQRRDVQAVEPRRLQRSVPEPGHTARGADERVEQPSHRRTLRPCPPAARRTRSPLRLGGEI